MKKQLSYIVSLVLLLAGFGAIAYNQQSIRDYYTVATTDLNPEALSLKANLPLTERGSFLYEASQTELDERAAFNEACSSVLAEHSIVLGCYGSQRIYIFKVDEPQLAGVEEVTAAHELLHASYDRLSGGKRQEIDRLLKQELAKISDPQILETINQYKKESDEVFANELHSIIGTEVATLSPALEAYYKNYFTDRSKIIGYGEKYKQVFRDNETAIANFDTQLKTKKAQIDSLEDSLAAQRQNLQQESNKLESLRTSNQSAYNAAVPGYNALVNQYNAGVASVKQLVAEHNQLVEQRNAIATAQNELSGKLSSTAEPVN